MFTVVKLYDPIDVISSFKTTDRVHVKKFPFSDCLLDFSTVGL